MASSATLRVEQTRNRRAEQRDIGPLPPVQNPKRKKRCATDLLRFLTAYLAQRFPLAFSEDHKRMIALIQKAILEGGQFAVAMPRGTGKTTVMEGACVWAQLYGHRRFIFVVAADAQAAEAICSNIRAEMDGNELLLADFPEAIHPIVVLEGISRRAEGQTLDGERTMLVWTKNEVRLPRTAAGGGSVIRTAGITGRIRGAKASLADGSQVRPDLVLVDDPQTDESARSPSQVAGRLKTMTGTILGLAGPGQQIAALTTCTVIEKGDLADQILDRLTHPEWQGVKAKLMHAMPTDQKRWDEYAEILREDMRTESGMGRATAYYRANRAAMDIGAEPAWKQRFGIGELSATQHAMNLLIIRGLPAFMAEYQNEPSDPLASGDIEQLTAPMVLRKLNGLDRGLVPIEATVLTAAIDVQGAALYWGAAAWTPGFSGDAIAYGAYPDQGRPYFTVQEIEKTMVKAHPGASWEASLFASLEALVEQIAGREWMRDDGGVQRVEQVVIDAGYGASTDTVYQFCRRSKYSAILLPFFGRTVAAGAAPMDEWKKKPGDRVGPGWRIPKPTNRQTRHILADVNKWKSFFADRILAPVGDAGCFSVYGKTPSEHRMLADQIAAETRTRVNANGRTADQWHPKPNRDNHYLDVFTMAAIAASIRGVKLDEQAIIRAVRSAMGPNGPAEPAEPVRGPSPPKPPPRPRPVGSGFLSGFGFGAQ